jgi:hypothetical protein
MIGVIFDVRIDDYPHTGDKSGDRSNTQRKQPRVIEVLRKNSAYDCRCSVAQRSHHRADELPPRKSRPGSCLVIHARPHAAGICKDRSDGDQDAEGHRESKAHHTVDPDGKTQSANRGEESFPGQRVMIVVARRSMQFDRDRDTGRYSGDHAKKETQSKCISDAEYDRVSYRPSEQPQRAVFATQQIVSQVQRAQHVQARAGDTDAGHQVMVDRMRKMHEAIVEGSRLPTKAIYYARAFFSFFL